MSRCPICHTPRNCEFFSKEGRTLLICESCRHIWWDLFPPESELREYYRLQYTRAHGQETIQADAREHYKGHLQSLLQLIGKAAPDSQICDYGCSIPILLLEAKRAGFHRALGVDYCQEAQQYGIECGVEILLPEQLADVPNSSLDIARFSHTLEHSVDPAAVLGQVLQKVRPGGLIYITQPNFPVFRFRRSARDLKDSAYPEHLHFFSPISLLELAARLALEVQQFFTHQNEELVLSTHENELDLDYAGRRLAAYKQRGEPSAHALGNYPCYTGENSVLYAFKPQP